jgi:uncharacterized FAD-dependent dehydrogenase
MTKNISITVLPGEETNEQIIREKAARTLGVRPSEITALVFKKKSIDARKGQIKFCLSYSVWVGEEPPAGMTDGNAEASAHFAPSWKQADPTRRVVIVGSGPAGLFAALKLLEGGITPIIVERGSPTAERKRDLALISQEQKINPESNYCFGEGGAGTFSDGKLYTRSNKRGDIGRILAIFRHHGADAAILTDAHPHIGTEKLPLIINKMRETILEHGGEMRFGTRCAGLIVENGRVAGVRVESGNLAAGEKTATATETIRGDAVILATGHSASDIYSMMADLERSLGTEGKKLLEAKTFAVGVRVEHPRELIDRIQYHGRERGTELPAATYRLTAQVDGRGVYSFCMCPGGHIVPSATADDEIVVNGMSPANRNSRWSNAAIVVETHPEDIPAEFGSDSLAGLRFRQWLEREAKKRGEGQKAPAQRLVDFIEERDSSSLPSCSYAPGVVPSRLDRWLPAQIADRLRKGFVEFNKFMKGFISPDAIVVGVETRTSSPVRILRDNETLECPGIAGLYPAGEGSGYAGGIVSSAMDGERCAEKIMEKLAGR